MANKENSDYLMQRAIDAGITDRRELANFMGQMQVESGHFNTMDENLHYSGGRLLEYFHGRGGINDITSANRIAAAGPEAVGNAIYDGVNGNTEPGDGFAYHGRGYVQLTGRGLYSEYAQYTGLDLVAHPELAANRENAATIALAYWNHVVVTHNAGQDVDRASRLINGGDNGIQDRRIAVAAWGHKLEQGYVPGAPEPALPRILEQSMSGNDVRHAQDELQTLGYLHATPDGSFGNKTKGAVEDFQRAKGLSVDGKIGPHTQKALDGAVRDKQISDLTSGLPSLREFSDPSHPQNALYNTLRDGFPPGTSPERLSQATAACYMSGIRQPDDLGNVTGTNGKIFFDTESLLARPAQIDISQPAPSVQQTMQQVQQYDQQQAQVQAQVQQANLQANMQQQGPVMGGPQMGGH